MARYTYTINADNVVSFFDAENPNENGAPFMLQPWHPNNAGAPWTEEEATAWAEEALEHFLNPPTEEEYIPQHVLEHRENMISVGKEPLY
jgi:hypothetical protein